MATAERCGDNSNLRAGPCRLRPFHVGDHEWESSSGWRRTWPQTYNGPSPLDDPPAPTGAVNTTYSENVSP